MKSVASLLAALAVGFIACQSGPPVTESPPRVTATLSVGSRPGTPVLGGAYVWVPNTGDGTISKIDAKRNRVVSTIRIGNTETLLDAGCGAPDVHSFPVGNFDVRRCDLPSSLAYRAGSLWALKNDGPALLRLDPGSDRVLASTQLPGEPFEMAAGPSGIWITDFQHSTLTQVDDASGRVLRTLSSLGAGPSRVLVAEDAVWVAMSLENTVVRLDPVAGTVVARIPLGNRPLAMTSGAGALWVRNEKSSSVARIEPTGNRLEATIPVTFFLGRDGQDGLAFAGGRVWAGGVELDGIDPGENVVVERVRHLSVTLVGASRTVWTADIGGTVSRVDV
jgi:DNA-binding beta-propeller fold protein YncE